VVRPSEIFLFFAKQQLPDGETSQQRRAPSQQEDQG
jgi:hypothetical protein